MRKGLFAVVVSLCLWRPAITHAQSLDTPLNGSFVSGIGYVRGWKCTGGNLTYTIDNGPSASLSYGGERGDTQGVCGDANNGFITQPILRTDFKRKGLTKQARNCLNVSVQLSLKRFLADDNCH
jgi:hypothetical protein